MKKIVVAVVVYDRLNNLEEWIRCFKLCNTQEAELIIIHNYKDEQSIQECKTICTDVKNIHRPNIGYDIGALQDVCNERLEGFPNDWDYLLWITDDLYPMDRNFISSFIEEIERPDVGIACVEISEENRRHVRSSGFIISKETALLLEFPSDPVLTKDQCYQFEFNSNNSLIDQIIKMNKKVVQISEELSDSPLWDTHLRGRLNRWEEFHKTFPK